MRSQSVSSGSFVVIHSSSLQGRGNGGSTFILVLFFQYWFFTCRLLFGSVSSVNSTTGASAKVTAVGFSKLTRIRWVLLAECVSSLQPSLVTRGRRKYLAIRCATTVASFSRVWKEDSSIVQGLVSFLF